MFKKQFWSNIPYLMSIIRYKGKFIDNHQNRNPLKLVFFFWYLFMYIFSEVHLAEKISAPSEPASIMQTLPTPDFIQRTNNPVYKNIYKKQPGNFSHITCDNNSSLCTRKHSSKILLTAWRSRLPVCNLFLFIYLFYFCFSCCVCNFGVWPWARLVFL